MERVTIRSLVTGAPLDGPLYDKRKKLLLAQGHTFTQDMLISLLHSGTEYAYLGEWDAEEVRRSESAAPLLTYRKDAEKMARALSEEMDRRLAEEELDVQPTGEALDDSTDHSFQSNRSAQQVKECESVCNRGTDLVEQVVQGQIEEERVAEATSNIMASVIDAFSTDKSLLLNLTNLKSKTDYLYRHSLNTAVLAVNIAAALNYGREQIHSIGIGAMLQDIGMAMVPEHILNAQRGLTKSEFVDIQKHTVRGLYAIEKMRGLPYVARFVAYQSHERADGTGYPQKRRKDVIHKYAQIVSVADTFDALTSDRPWRQAYHPYEAMKYIIQEANKGKYDPDIVRGMLRHLSLFPIGSLVKLSSGEVGKVVHSNGDVIDRPIVSAITDAAGRKYSEPVIVDLKQHEDVKVADVVEENQGVDIADGFQEPT